ncbi:unknown [Clostridium sp. CAG:253]|nr:unknown [Clostridium sp. CAG:253]
MTQKEEITKCLAEYAWNICTVQRFYMGDSIPAKALKNAIKTYATGVSESDVIALLLFSRLNDTAFFTLNALTVD